MPEIDSIALREHSCAVNTKGFSAEQQSALLDLLVLGMYQDRHLALAEDRRVQSLLKSFDFGSDYERQQFADASFARIHAMPKTPEAIRSAVFASAVHFKDQKQRRQALDTLADLLASDSKVTTEENQFLQTVEEALELK